MRLQERQKALLDLVKASGHGHQHIGCLPRRCGLSLLTLLLLPGALMGAQLEGAGACQDLVLGIQSLLSMPLLTGRERTV